MPTQVRLIVLALVVVTVLIGCGSDTSDAPEAKGTGSGDIVFTVNREGWNEIWVMDPSGGNRRRLTDPPPPATDAPGNMSPAWSPTGDRIAFVSTGEARTEDPDTYELNVMDAGDGAVRQLTKNGDLDADPTWSPSGDRIAFVRAQGWGTERVTMSLRVIEADGSGERVLREETNKDGRVSLDGPAWSPDGTKIAFTRSAVSEESFETALYVTNPDGSELTKIAAEAGDPAWSPDGTRIAFTSIADRAGETCFHECDPSGEIYVANADGSDAVRLTRNEANDTSPTWSPDGKRILFSSDRSNRDDHELELYVLPASGGEPRRLTRNKVWDSEPDWR